MQQSNTSNPFEAILSRLESMEAQLSELQKHNAAKPATATPEPEPELLTRNEAAKLLKCSLTTLHARINDGSLKYYTLKGRVYFKKAEILDSLTASR